MKIKLTLPNNIIREYPAGMTLLEVSRDFAANYQSPIVEGIFNGIGTDLQKPVFENGTVESSLIQTINPGVNVKKNDISASNLS